MAEQPLPADVRFMLGEMSAIVRTLPDRMTRSETDINTRLARIESDISTLKTGQAGHKTIIYTIAGLISAGISGIITHFLPH